MRFPPTRLSPRADAALFMIAVLVLSAGLAWVLAGRPGRALRAPSGARTVPSPRTGAHASSPDPADAPKSLWAWLAGPPADTARSGDDQMSRADRAGSNPDRQRQRRAPWPRSRRPDPAADILHGAPQGGRGRVYTADPEVPDLDGLPGGRSRAGRPNAERNRTGGIRTGSSDAGSDAGSSDAGGASAGGASTGRSPGGSDPSRTGSSWAPQLGAIAQKGLAIDRQVASMRREGRPESGKGRGRSGAGPAQTAGAGTPGDPIRRPDPGTPPNAPIGDHGWMLVVAGLSLGAWRLWGGGG
jgi:hypothetical protein